MGTHPMDAYSRKTRADSMRSHPTSHARLQTEKAMTRHMRKERKEASVGDAKRKAIQNRIKKAKGYNE